MQAYLDSSINNLYINYVNSNKHWSEDADYKFLRDKSWNLYNKYINLERYDCFTNLEKNVCLATSFWIISKLYDDDPFQKAIVILEGFELKESNIQIDDLNECEIAILKSQNWELNYLPKNRKKLRYKVNLTNFLCKLCRSK